MGGERVPSRPVLRIRRGVARHRVRARPVGAPIGKHGCPSRDFTTTGPNEKWLTDITEHPTGEGKLYLCAVKDCYSHKIVGIPSTRG